MHAFGPYIYIAKRNIKIHTFGAYIFIAKRNIKTKPN